MSDRKLATVRVIDELRPIEGADAIECAMIGGWAVVVKKGEFKEGDLCVYLEVDSWVPTSLAPFLTKPGHFPKQYKGIEGERLKTIKLRGQLSQGLVLPIHSIGNGMSDSVGAVLMNLEAEAKSAGVQFEPNGADLTDLLGIEKWEKEIPANMRGTVKGSFPSFIPKTDQERCQNLKRELEAVALAADDFEVTEKLEGSSMTIFINKDGEFGVCSRNLELKFDENNTFWATAVKIGAEAALRKVYDAEIADFGECGGYAVQGELIGPGVEGNIYGLTEHTFKAYDVYDIKAGKYMTPLIRRAFVINVLGLDHVPVLEAFQTLCPVDTVSNLLARADGKSQLADVLREGVVYKHNAGGITFKAISNQYLLKQKD